MAFLEKIKSTYAFNPQSWNLYSYVNGNTVNFNDPMGHYGNPPGWTKATLYGPGGAFLPTSFEYGGDWISSQIFEFFGVKPIYITLNAVIDEKMSEEDKSKAKNEFEDQLEKANKVYNKIAIYLSADVKEGPVPRVDCGTNVTLKESRKYGVPGEITVFLSNSYKKAFGAVDVENHSGYAWIPIVNGHESSWHLAHELGHIFGFRYGDPIWTNSVNDSLIDNFNYSMRGIPLFPEVIPSTLIFTALLLRNDASIWGSQ